MPVMTMVSSVATLVLAFSITTGRDVPEVPGLLCEAIKQREAQEVCGCWTLGKGQRP